MSFWEKLRGRFSGTPPDEPRPASDRAVWLAADDKGNPFGVPILDLTRNLKMTSMTKDPEVASRSMSWKAGDHDRLTWDIEGESIPCDLEYAAASSLPSGMLFIPAAMEDKWVIAVKDGQVAVARSWSGETSVIADVVHSGERLRVTRLTVAHLSPLRSFGESVSTFDWLIKAHALGERIPLPVSAEGSGVLEAFPLSSFSPFGRRVFCAARDYSPPPSLRPLRSDGKLIAAVREGDAAQIQRLVAAGADVHAPATFAGYAALHIAIVKRLPALVRLLISLGADPNQAADAGTRPLMLAFVHGSDPEVVEALLEAGAALEGANDDGFRPLHAAAEVGSVSGIELLMAKGADIQARTKLGVSPLHIACALGHLDAARALHAHCADVRATSEHGTPLDAARSEGKPEVVAWLESLPTSSHVRS